MCKCWQHDPEKRPTFKEIYSTLEKMQNRENPTQISKTENGGYYEDVSNYAAALTQTSSSSEE